MIATVVGVLFFPTRLALIKSATEFGSAAREHAPHCPVVGGGELVPVGMGVGLPMRTEQGCEGEGHDLRFYRAGGVGFLLTIGKDGEGFAAFALADFREVEVGHDFLERAVAEVGGDLSDRGSAF